MGNKSYWHFFIAISLTVFVVFIVQFHQPLIIGADGYLHNYLAHEMSGSGFVKEIPQAKFSWFETKFSDKDFIYHLISVPFVRLFSGFLGMKIIAFMTASALFIVIICLLNIYTKSKYLILFSILPIFSAQFLRDTAEARPFTLAILLTLIGIHFLIKEKTI